MRPMRLLLAALVLSFAALQACTAIVGDACTTQTDCGRTMFCEQSLPDGYCTLKDCLDTGCPSEGICISFDADTSWCMAICDADGDCRDGYRSVKDFGKHGFCNDIRGTTPDASEAATPENSP